MMTAGPLNEVKFVEMTMFQQGPVAGMCPGDLGGRYFTEWIKGSLSGSF